MFSIMSLFIIKSKPYLINGLLITLRFGHKSSVYSDVRSMFTFKGGLNQNSLTVSSKTRFTFTQINTNDNNFNLLDNGFNSGHCRVITRCLAKGRDKVKDKKKDGKPKVLLTDEELNETIPINELRIELNSVINRFKTDLISNVNIRSNPQSIENLVVELDGRKHSLNELVNITRKSPQLVVLNMSSTPDAIKPVLTAIADSGMNLSPQQEGNVIYLPIPKVTREHREGLANNAKQLFQRAKEELKDIQSSFTSYVKKQKKSNVSEDYIFNVSENLKFIIDSKVSECQQILDQKLKDLLN